MKYHDISQYYTVYHNIIYRKIIYHNIIYHGILRYCKQGDIINYLYVKLPLICSESPPPQKITTAFCSVISDSQLLVLFVFFLMRSVSFTLVLMPHQIIWFIKL